MAFQLETHQLFQRLLIERNGFRAIGTRLQVALDMIEKSLVAMVRLEVAVPFFIDRQKFGNMKVVLPEVFRQIKESLVFLHIGVIGADDGTFVS